jgi:hypothetical protein
MAARLGVTAITTITGFSHIPPLRVAQIVGDVANTFVSNSAVGYHQKSGDSGDFGDARPTVPEFRAVRHLEVERDRRLGMKREYRQPTRSEWQHITSARPVVRRIPKPSGRLETPPKQDKEDRLAEQESRGNRGGNARRVGGPREE